MFDVKYDVQKTYWEGTGKRRTPNHPVVSAFADGKSSLLFVSASQGDAEAIIVGGWCGQWVFLAKPCRLF